MITHTYSFTLSKLAGFVCLIYAGVLMFWFDQFEEGAKWGAFGMAIFSVKNFTK